MSTLLAKNLITSYLLYLFHGLLYHVDNCDNDFIKYVSFKEYNYVYLPILVVVLYFFKRRQKVCLFTQSV